MNHRWIAVIIALLGIMAVAYTIDEGMARAQIPQLPALYANGTATLNGQPGSGALTARVGAYTSAPVDVAGGLWTLLIVAPTDPGARGQPVTFHLGGLVADQVGRFQSATTFRDTALTFSGLVPSPTPTPIPGGTPIDPEVRSALDGLLDLIQTRLDALQDQIDRLRDVQRAIEAI